MLHSVRFCLLYGDGSRDDRRRRGHFRFEEPHLIEAHIDELDRFLSVDRAKDADASLHPESAAARDADDLGAVRLFDGEMRAGEIRMPEIFLLMQDELRIRAAPI